MHVSIISRIWSNNIGLYTKAETAIEYDKNHTYTLPNK